MTDLYTAEQSRTVDAMACADGDLNGFILMTRAAEALFTVVTHDFAHAHNITVYVGRGNNAGDGFLLAEKLHAAQRAVHVVCVGDPDELSGDAQSAHAHAHAAGVTMTRWVDGTETIPDLAVDALFGTGLSRPPAGDFAAAIEQINHAPQVLAADIPSGLCADTGCAADACVHATATVTFITRKRGLYLTDGPDCAGIVHFADLNVAAGALLAADTRLCTWEHCQTLRTPRRRNSHKNTYGHVLTIGGGAGSEGAAVLCASAALRAGCGLSSIARPPGAVNLGAPPELMCQAEVDRHTIDPLLRRADVVAIGPGLGQGAAAQELFGAVLAGTQPLVVDADALRLLAAEPTMRDDWVLTPHPGEAAALLNVTCAQVQADRITAARDLAHHYGGVAVLKGCGTIIADDTDTFVCGGGNSGLATAGAGDVLAGIIASLAAQGQPLRIAARLGVCLHAAAGDVAGRNGEAGLIASDLLPTVQQVLGGAV